MIALADFVLDTSALIAILNAEPEFELFIERIENSERPLISAATLFEACCVARSYRIAEGPARLDRIVALIDPEIVPFDAHQMLQAREAYLRYGKGSQHPARLNLGDCFSYALAKTNELPLMFKGDDFIHTDLRPLIS